MTHHAGMAELASVPSFARLVWMGRDGGLGPEQAVRLLPPLLEVVPDAELIIMGDAKDQSTARDLAGDLRIADRVTLSSSVDDVALLLRSASLLLVTDDPSGARGTIDLAAAYGLQAFICVFEPDETRQQQGKPSHYIVHAREIVRLLRGGMVDASQNSTMVTPASRTADGQLDGPPPRRRKRGGVWRAMKRRTRRIHDGGRFLLAEVNPRQIPDRLVRSAASFFDQAPQPALIPIRTLDFSSLGLGDTLMAWAGLQALLHGGYRPLAPGCTMYVPRGLTRTGTALFARHGVRVLPAIGDAMDIASPVLSPRTPRTWRELYRSIAGPDWHMNCFPAVDAQKPPLRADHRYASWERMCLGLTERLLYRRRGWQAAPADYVGFRLWMPIARRLGIFPIAFLALFKQSLPRLRAEMSAWVKPSGRAPTPLAPIAIFPSGRSYQAFPADFCRRLQDRLHDKRAVFYVTADDPWIDAYRDERLNIVHLDTIEDLLAVLLVTPGLVTTDSFTSHAAQLLRDDFLLILTRDIRENVLHPGANPKIIAHHPRCAPCHYVPRVDLTSCPARYDRCIAFENDDLLDRIVASVMNP